MNSASTCPGISLKFSKNGELSWSNDEACGADIIADISKSPELVEPPGFGSNDVSPGNPTQARRLMKCFSTAAASGADAVRKSTSFLASVLLLSAQLLPCRSSFRLSVPLALPLLPRFLGSLPVSFPLHACWQCSAI